MEIGGRRWASDADGADLLLFLPSQARVMPRELVGGGGPLTQQMVLIHSPYQARVMLRELVDRGGPLTQMVLINPIL